MRVRRGDHGFIVTSVLSQTNGNKTSTADLHLGELRSCIVYTNIYIYAGDCKITTRRRPYQSLTPKCVYLLRCNVYEPMHDHTAYDIILYG